MLAAASLAGPFATERESLRSRPMAYRSSRIRAAPGVEVLPPIAVASRPRRVTNAALDGLALPLVAALPRRKVTVGDYHVPLHYEFRRWTWRTERCVEIALGARAVRSRRREDVLEVGNVLPLAGVAGQTIVDKYEEGPGVLNVDIVDFDPGRTYELVVSISTLEHVGRDEVPQDPDKAPAALERVAQLGGELLVTIPVGVHPRLESAFLTGPFDHVALLVKTGRLARWQQRPIEERAQVRYGSPYACGNAILVGMRGRPLGPAGSRAAPADSP